MSLGPIKAMVVEETARCGLQETDPADPAPDAPQP